MEHRNIFSEWFDQFLSPWKHLSFVGFFIGFVIIIGCVGIYSPIYHTIVDENYSSWNIVENILTYSIALIMPACVTLILNSFSRTDQKVSLIVYTILLFVLLPLVLCFVSYLSHNAIPAIICFVLSLIAWVLANHDNSGLLDASYEKNIKTNVENNSKGWE